MRERTTPMMNRTRGRRKGIQERISIPGKISMQGRNRTLEKIHTLGMMKEDTVGKLNSVCWTLLPRGDLILPARGVEGIERL